MRCSFPGAGEVASDGALVDGQESAVLLAPAKLTISLKITGVRPDGYHLIDAEMATVDLCDELRLAEGEGIQIVDEVVGGRGIGTLGTTPDNLVGKALDVAGKMASVRLVKRIPLQAGLGGGSADAAAVLRWAGVTDPHRAAALGADVPFCVVGGRARVQGIGELVEPLPFVRRSYVLLLPPCGVDTAACYRMWDDLGSAPVAQNDLEAAAVALVPELGEWRDQFGAVTNQRPRLAGSGSTWFVEGTLDQLGLAGRSGLILDGQLAPLVPVQTVPAQTKHLPAEPGR